MESLQKKKKCKEIFKLSSEKVSHLNGGCNVGRHGMEFTVLEEALPYFVLNMKHSHHNSNYFLLRQNPTMSHGYSLHKVLAWLCRSPAIKTRK